MRNLHIPHNEPPPPPKFDLKTTTGILIWSEGDHLQSFRAVVPDTSRAYALNKFLGTYPKDTRFKKGEEPQFRFNRNQLSKVIEILGIKEVRLGGSASPTVPREARATEAARC